MLVFLSHLQSDPIHVSIKILSSVVVRRAFPISEIISNTQAQWSAFLQHVPRRFFFFLLFVSKYHEIYESKSVKGWYCAVQEDLYLSFGRSGGNVSWYQARISLVLQRRAIFHSEAPAAPGEPAQNEWARHVSNILEIINVQLPGYIYYKHKFHHYF